MRRRRLHPRSVCLAGVTRACTVSGTLPTRVSTRRCRSKLRTSTAEGSKCIVSIYRPTEVNKEWRELKKGRDKERGRETEKNREREKEGGEKGARTMRRRRRPGRRPLWY